MRIAYDVDQKKVGCSIIQAAYGADTTAADHFDTEDWLTSPSPGMKVYEVSPGQLAELVVITRSARNDT